MILYIYTLSIKNLSDINTNRSEKPLNMRRVSTSRFRSNLTLFLTDRDYAVAVVCVKTCGNVLYILNNTRCCKANRYPGYSNLYLSRQCCIFLYMNHTKDMKSCRIQRFCRLRRSVGLPFPSAPPLPCISLFSGSTLFLLPDIFFKTFLPG